MPPTSSPELHEPADQGNTFDLTPEMIETARVHWLNVWDLGKTLKGGEIETEGAQMLACGALFLAFARKWDVNVASALNAASRHLGTDGVPPSEAIN